MGCGSSVDANHDRPQATPQRYRADGSVTVAPSSNHPVHRNPDRVAVPTAISGSEGNTTESGSFTVGGATPVFGSLPDRLINFGSAIDGSPLADDQPLHSLANSIPANSAYTHFGVSVVSVQSSTSFDGDDGPSFMESVNSTTAVRNY